MLRHRNVKTEEPQNQGIFIGEYEEPASSGRLKSGSDSSSCWKKFAVILLIITGASISLNVYQLISLSSEENSAQLKAERGNVEACLAELKVMQEEMEKLILNGGVTVPGVVRGGEGDTPPTPHPELKHPTPPQDQELLQRQIREEEEKRQEVQRQEQERKIQEAREQRQREEQEKIRQQQQQQRLREEQEKIRQQQQQQQEEQEKIRQQQQEQQRLREEQEKIRQQQQQEEQEKIRQQQQEQEQQRLREEQERKQLEEQRLKEEQERRHQEGHPQG